MERRDLHITRIVMNRQKFQSDALELADSFLASIRHGAGLTPNARGFFHSWSHPSQQQPAASGGVHQFSMQRGPSSFSNHSFVIRSIRVVAIEYNEEPDHASEIAQVCGEDGGCVVEVLVHFSGDVTSRTLAALFPNLVDGSRLIGHRISFPSRLLLYFDAQRRLVRQVAQADIVAAFSELRLEEPSAFAVLANAQ